MHYFYIAASKFHLQLAVSKIWGLSCMNLFLTQGWISPIIIQVKEW